MSSTTDLIRQLQALGLKQTAISERTGIPQPRLSRWSAGQAPVGADDALKLQALLAEVTAAAAATAVEPSPAVEPAEEVSHARADEPALQGAS